MVKEVKSDSQNLIYNNYNFVFLPLNKGHNSAVEHTCPATCLHTEKSINTQTIKRL